MKNKLLYLILLVAGMAFAQPAIQQPSDYLICDTNNDGIATFDLTTKIPEILNDLDPSLYIFTFYETLEDAEFNALNNAITNTIAYTNVGSMTANGTQAIYVRVTNTTDENDYAIATLNLVVGQTPVLNQLQDLVVYEDLIDEAAQFDLTTQNQYIVNLPSLYSIMYYLTLADAQAGINPIAMPQQFTNTSNPQVIYVRVEDVNSGCFAITDFNLVVTEGIEPIVNIPDVNFKMRLIALGHDTSFDGEIQVSEANAISFLELGEAGILDLTGINSFHNLSYLYCNDNNLTALSISGLPMLQEIHVDANLLTEVNLNNLPQLNVFYAPNNNLTTIDLSQVDVIELTLAFNTGLTHINLKNGIDGVHYLDIENTDVQLICTDEADVAGYAANFPNVQVSSYCDFTPGGNYNTITGTVLFDRDNNGCNAQDMANDFIKVNITGNGQTGSAFANTNGNYTFYTQAGEFTLTPQFENNSLFNINPAAVSFTDNNNNTQTQDFCITANGVHSDVEVVIAPIVAAQPGFNAVYKVVYKNKGNQIENGTITFTYNDNVLDYVTSLPAENNNVPGTLTYNYSNLMPFENREVIVTFNVNSPMETPAVNIDDVLDYSASITVAGTDEMPNDNNFELHQVVVGSFDPNDITCLQGNMAPETAIGDYLHYIVNFENTGTAPATFVVVKQEIDAAMFDVNSLQVLNSSHGVTATVTGNKVEFVFDNINLGSYEHGNILFKLKSLSTLQTGDTVMNQANIYFDYNFPIVTNEANTTFATLSAGDFVKDASVSIYPNPTNGMVNIKAGNTIKSVELFDIQGRLLQTGMVNDVNTTVDISGRQTGIYFVRIKTDKGMNVEKIMKK